MTTLKNKHAHHSDFQLSEDVEKIKAALLEASHDVKDKAGEILFESMEDLKDRSTKIKGNVENFTSEQPFKSLGMALLVGLAIGYLMRK